MPVELRFRRLPFLPRLYLRGVVGRRRMPTGPFRTRIPAMQADLDGLRADESTVQQYREVCGLPDDGQLPHPFPHVLATPLHMSLVMHRAFPYPALGMIHVRQVMTQYASLGSSEPYSVHCRFAAERPARKGIEFDLVTELRCDGELAWEGITTVLVPSKHGRSGRRERKAEPQPLSAEASTRQFHVSENVGRKYARVTHDYNPIHLHALTARPFGFRAPIAHGMWSVARCLAELKTHVPAPPLRTEVAFRRPLTLPADVRLHFESRGDTLRFTLDPVTEERSHLLGSIDTV